MFKERIEALEKVLSLPYVDFQFEVGAKKFNFHIPLDKAEIKQQAKMRKEFIRILVKDAALTMAREALNSYYNDFNQDTAFMPIDKIISSVKPREHYENPLGAEYIQEIKDRAAKIKEETGKNGAVGLNVEAYQVRMQDEDTQYEFREDGV